MLLCPTCYTCTYMSQLSCDLIKIGCFLVGVSYTCTCTCRKILVLFVSSIPTLLICCNWQWRDIVPIIACFSACFMVCIQCTCAPELNIFLMIDFAVFVCSDGNFRITCSCTGLVLSLWTRIQTLYFYYFISENFPSSANVRNRQVTSKA